VVSTVTNVSCRDAGDGSIDIVVSGATPPYTYVWSANANGFTGTNLTGLSGASYQVTITDSRNCTKALSFNINEPTRFRSILSQSIDSTACDGTILDGRIGNNTNGGTQPYTYQWSSGDSTREITTNLEYGTYTLTATDANGCADTVDITLVARNVLQVQLLTDSSGCFGDNTGTAEVIITGGRRPYFVEWPGLDSTNTTFVNRIAPGNYDVTVTDSKGCDTSFNFTITEQPEMSVVVPDTLNVTFGLDTSFNIEINGLRPGDESSFYWNPTEWLSCNTCTQPRITAIRNREYIIELDVNGCLYYDTLQLIVDFGPDPYYIPNAFTPNGDNVNDFFQIFGVGIEDLVYTIYNRWGGLVFSGQGMGATWDGTYNGQDAQAGVYVYNAYFIFLDKSTERVTGTITLIR
jgi:gliding motility-associated-like protein